MDYANNIHYAIYSPIMQFIQNGHLDARTFSHISTLHWDSFMLYHMQSMQIKNKGILLTAVPVYGSD